MMAIINVLTKEIQQITISNVYSTITASYKFFARKTCMLSSSGLTHDPSPPEKASLELLNSLSDVLLVAQMQRYFFANFARFW